MASFLPSTDLLAILPEIVILLLIGLLLLLDSFSKRTSKKFLGWVAVGGLLTVLIVKIFFLAPGNEPTSAWGGMLRVDTAAFFFQILILIGSILTVLFSMDYHKIELGGDYFAMLLLSVIGMNLMAAAADLIILYLAIETTSIPLYVLAGFNKKDNSSVESGMKYLLFGAMTSAIMLYGFSLLYGFSGFTNLNDIASVISTGSVPVGIEVLILFLVIAGFGFKVSAVPFHFWAPDVYQGAPTPISGFLSTTSKAAGFIVFIRFMLTVFATSPQKWMVLAAILAIATMTIGNLLALVQKDLKRLLAYSSIAHAGYILVGVASCSQLGLSAAMFYLLVYLFTNLAAFGIVSLLEDRTGSSEIANLQGLTKKSPFIAYAFLIAILSLAGIPPFGGFVSKLLILAAGIEAHLTWLVMIVIINSIVGLFYYLILIKNAFSSSGDLQSISPTVPWQIAIIVSISGVIVLGIIYSPWFNWLSTAAINLVALY